MKRRVSGLPTHTVYRRGSEDGTQMSRTAQGRLAYRAAFRTSETAMNSWSGDDTRDRDLVGLSKLEPLTTPGFILLPEHRTCPRIPRELWARNKHTAKRLGKRGFWNEVRVSLNYSHHSTFYPPLLALFRPYQRPALLLSEEPLKSQSQGKQRAPAAIPGP
jgi:hypothetical protein